MFKIESFLTPYISAYLARYVKNFKTDDFQVSFWQGGATFNNVNLNLEALEAELNLPAVRLVSGHIHELKISVPWTKITSEPITVSVNTIEIVLKLRGPNETTSTERSHTAQKRILERKKSQEEPTPSYVQHLTNKILQNVEIVFENVVLKYTEDDIVLSLNIRKAALKCVNSNWEPAFIELTAPAFILRKCWTCSDLTVCLDKTNNVGKIETYMDPLLYKCSFDVRVLYQYHGPYVRAPYFVRHDLYLENMHISISDEQIPMVLRLYTLIYILTTIDYEDRLELSDKLSEESIDEENQESDSMMGWASWAVSWVPAIPEAIFGPMDESMEPLLECEFSVPVIHYGIFIDRATIILKAKEHACDMSYYKSRRRVKFLPFLKCQLQGTSCDVILRGLDTDSKIGVSELVVSGMGTCPCGLNDCGHPDDDRVSSDSSHVFIHLGKVHKEFACESMFSPILLTMGEIRPPADYHFNWKDHLEEYTEKKMLDRTPGIAFELFEVLPVFIAQIDKYFENTSPELSSTKGNYCLCRLVIAPLQIKVNSSLIHRAKLIHYSSNQYCDSQYAQLRELVCLKNTDILLTCSFIEITLYELMEEIVTNAGSTIPKLFSLKPLLYISFTQPHWITHITSLEQSMEISAFDVRLGFGSKIMVSSQDLVLPQKDNFSIKLLRSIAGIKNPETGMSDPYFTLKLTDFSLPTCKASFDLFRPVRIVFSKDLLEVVSRSLALFHLPQEFEDPALDQTQDKQELISTSRNILSKFSSVVVNVNQIVVSVKVNPAALPSAAVTLALSSMELVMSSKKKYAKSMQDLPDNIVIESSFNGVMVTSKLRDRSDIILNPWNVKVGASFQWHHWYPYPMSAISVTAEPLSIYFGPQNILSALQVYHCLDHIIKSYFKPNPDSLSSGFITMPKVQTFNDDLRAGAFKYVRDSKYPGHPDIYQILFCENRKSMTWRYPQPRYLSKIAASPVPFNTSTGKNEFLECSIEYWEEAERHFKELRKFTLSETSGVNVELPIGNDVVHKFVSNLWRISITPPLDEDDSKMAVRPELLACLQVDSVYNPLLVQNLNLVVDISKITVHLDNHLSFTGRISEEKLARYSYKGVSTQDQTFATIELSTSSLVWQRWLDRSSLNWMSYFKCTVVDYSFLTESVFIEPFNFQAKVGWNEDTFSSLDFLANPVVVKMGGTVFHTLVSSFLTWSQVLASYTGNKVDLSGNQNKINVILPQIVLCNDTASALNVSQDGTNSSISLLMRQCYGFNWSSPKAPAQCKLRLKGEKNWSKSFWLKLEGYIVRTVANNLSLFINISLLSPSQIMVTMSGGLIIANALHESIDVTIIPQFGGKEINYSIAGRSHGPSQVINTSEIKEFQFKYSKYSAKDLQWSKPVSLEDLKKSASRSVGITLTCEKTNGAFDVLLPTEGIQRHNVWCSLVEETIDNCVRYMVIVCPFFRVKSSLAAPTITHVSTGKGEIENSSLMEGKGSEIQIDFVGNREATLHLTFQHCLTAKNSHSKPTIPLNPNGPALEKVFISRPIDEILSQVVATTGKKELWPFIQEQINLNDWVLVETQPETEVQVEFRPWIQGLPSILIDAKPCGLFVNIAGKNILFSENDGAEKVYQIPSTCVFTPSKIKESFKIGIEMEDISCWTENLEFTEQKSRTDIHYVNSNWKIPIDCFSRVEIFGPAETCYLTLETRIQKGIIVLTIRSTYSIQNRTEIPIIVKALSLTPSIIPPEKDLKLHDFITLDPLGLSHDLADPLLTFYSVSDKTGKKADNSGIKYLAIGCGSGPTWFVQLMKFELIFNNMSSTQGIPGRRLALSLQNCQAQWVKGTAKNFVEVTYPITLNWICKNGQVWISIAVDKSPQIIFFNESNTSFVFAESSGISNVTFKDNDHFKQYLTLPSFAIAHFSLPSLWGRFPELNQSERKMSILLGKCNNLLPVTPQCTSIYYETSQSQLEWSNEISLTKISGLQAFRIGGFENMEHYQLRVEQLGLSFYIYIQKMSKISAKDVCGRIAEFGFASTLHLKSIQNVNSESSKIKLTRSRRRSREQEDIFHELETIRPEASKLEKVISMTGTVCHATVFHSPLFRVFLPLVRLILTDDFTETHHKREILGLTLQDLFVDITPETDPNALRILQDRPQENTVINIRLGDLQIDNALYEEKKYDFPVIIKRETDYKPASCRAGLPFDTLDNMFRSVSNENHFFVEFTGLVGMSSPTERNFQKVWLQLQPVAVYFEDKFLYFMNPVCDKLLNVIFYRLLQLKSRQSALSEAPIQLSRRLSSTDSSISPTPPKSSTFNFMRKSKARSHECFFTPPGNPLTNIGAIPTIYEELMGDENSTMNLLDEKIVPESEPSTISQKQICMPSEILSIINEFSHPIQLQQIVISPVTVYVTMRLSTTLYLAVDHSPLELSRFEARAIVTTNLALGQALSVHYLQGAIFGSANPVRLIGSLELLGSPGSLARSFTTGVKDFVFYPIQGLFEGPAGFVTGLTYGCSSLLSNVGSGTLTSVTNLAWSVSRNLDRLTLNEEEQLQREEDRRAPIDGVSDGIIHGLTGFGIRLLGAIGGLAQHPIESVIDNGASPLRLLAGFSRGLLGVITKPIGGAVELVAMTGQGILTGAGWSPKLKRKHERLSENVDTCSNSLLKYHWMLYRERDDEEARILLLSDASQIESTSSTAESIPVCILLTTENIYIINTALDEIIHEIRVTSIIVENTNDNSMLSVRPAPPKKSEAAEERLIDFVKGLSLDNTNNSLESIHEATEHQDTKQPSTSTAEPIIQNQKPHCFDIFVDPCTKCEFITLLKFAQEQKNGRIFPVF